MSVTNRQAEREIVADTIADLVKSGQSFKQVAEALNAKGYRTWKRNSWTELSVKQHCYHYGISQLTKPTPQPAPSFKQMRTEVESRQAPPPPAPQASQAPQAPQPASQVSQTAQPAQEPHKAVALLTLVNQIAQTPTLGVERKIAAIKAVLGA